MKSRVLKFFQDIKGWRLWLLISALVMVGVEIIVMVMDMWLKGLVLQDDLLIGLVAVGFVSPTFLFLTEYLRGEFVKQREHRLQLETVKELNDMQGSYQSMFDKNADAMLVRRVSDMRITDVNEAFCKLSGYSKAQVLGKDTLQLEVWNDISDRERMLAMLVQQGHCEEVEVGLILSDGSKMWASVSAVTLMLHGEPHVLATIRDISERKRIEAELRIAAIAFESQEGMMITDADKRMLKVNHAFTQITGYSSEEILGKTTSVLSSDNHNAAFYQDMWQSIADNGVWEGEIWDKRKNGQHFPLHLTITAVTDQNGLVTHYVGTLTDSTEREETLDKLRKAAEDLAQANAQIEDERALLVERVEERTLQLRHANQAKDAFLATMSHEIRTPLGGMLGMMDLLGRSGLEGKQKEMFLVAQNSGKNLLHIVDDILDWSKIEAGKLLLVPQAASLEEVLKSVVATYSQLAGTKDIHLHYGFDARLAEGHLFDAMRVAQILNNFTSNAIKFTTHGSIEVAATLLARQDGSEEVRLTVKDTGAGIAQSQQERLFQQYEQASADTARMYGGTGLGLAICRRLAEMMEGSLGVESEVGKGSSFHLTLRLAVANPQAQQMLRTRLAEEQDREPDKLPLMADGRPATVLLVDDHPVNRMLLKQQLQLLGLQVESASSGVPALPLWRDGNFDLLITDCHMPEMDGYELTRNIRNIERLESRPRMPVLAWTANVLSEEHQRCAEAGMDAVLTKPTELSELSAKLSHWLSLGRSVAVETKQIQDCTSGAVIDMAVLVKIAKRPVSQAAMLREFEVHNRNDVANLLVSLKEGNPAAVVRSSHRVKGASHMVGALELVALCSRIEESVNLGDMAAARLHAASRLPGTITRLEEFIARFVDER